MINPLNRYGSFHSNMYNLINQQYLSKFPLIQQTDSSIDQQKLTNALKWNEVAQRLNQSNLTLKSSIESISNTSFGNVESTNSDINTSDITVKGRNINGESFAPFTLTVQQVATKMEVKSKKYDDIQAALGISGKIKINGKYISITDTMSLTNIKNTINASNAGVTATISDGSLYLTSRQSGVEAPFVISDSVEKDNATSLNPDVASVATVLSSEEWMHEIEVLQRAEVITESSSYTNAINQVLTQPIIYDTSQWEGAKQLNVSFTTQSSTGKTGILIDYQDEENYTSAYLDTNTNELVLEKSINGVVEKTVKTFSASPDTTYDLLVSKDENGNFTVNIKDQNGNSMETVSSYWNDVQDLKGNSGIFGDSDSYIQSSDIQGVQRKEQNWIYTVDGVEYQRSLNDNFVTVGTEGIDHATIELHEVGKTTIKNNHDIEILNELGIMNSNGEFQTITSTPQNAIYRINNGEEIQNYANTITYKGVELTFSKASEQDILISFPGSTDDSSENTSLKYEDILEFVSSFNTFHQVLSENQSFLFPFLQNQVETILQKNKTKWRDIGIKINGDGQLLLNSSILQKKLEQVPNEVSTLFQGKTGTIAALNTLVNHLSNDVFSYIRPPFSVRNGDASIFDRYY